MDIWNRKQTYWIEAISSWIEMICILSEGIYMNQVYIWGIGEMANILLKNGLNAEILGYIETFKHQEVFHNKKVYQYEEKLEEYDAIIVANMHSNEVYLSAKKINMDVNHMIFLVPCTYIVANNRLEWVEQILGKNNFEMYLGSHGLAEKTFFAEDKNLYQILNKRERFQIDESTLYPIINDKFAEAGTVSNYFWQDLWAAHLVVKNRPSIHYDIGSRLDGFIAHVLSSKIPVNMIDIRPLSIEIEGLKTIFDDATEMKQFEDDSIESLSALCSLEHFGLGRYGDAIDPEACFKCFENIQNKMKIGGELYISVPIGKERVEFNAHRIFYAETIVECFSKMSLLEFSCVAEGCIERNVNINKYDADEHRGDYRYGLFHFKKNKNISI